MAGERRRGRPKGTGINDQEMLVKIAQILAADPNKKRTTAIKEIGIDNPSIVRRLRDKYQEQEARLLAELAAKAAPAVNGHATAAAPKATGKGKGKGKAAQAQAPLQAEAPAPVVAQVEAVAPVQAQAQAETVTAEATPQVTVEAIAASQPAPAQAETKPQAAQAQPQAQAQTNANAAGASAKPQGTKSQQEAPAADPLAGLFSGVSLEKMFNTIIDQALGESHAEVKNSPIIAMIRQNLQLADFALPLASMFLSMQRPAAATAKAA